MNDAELDRLVETIKSKKDRRAAVLELLGSSETGPVRRLALARSFDAELAATLGVDASALEAVTRHPRVEPDVREGRWRVQPDYRATLLEGWTRTPSEREELSRVSQALAKHHDAARAPQAQVEALFHAVRADPVDAERRLRELFRKALDRFDLARCDELLAAVREARLPDTPKVLTDLHDELSRELNLRRRWAHDHYRTVYYLERRQTDELVDEVFTAQDAWIFQLYARGGLGKTMFVRNLIARRCAPRGIPCALIDFDLVPADGGRPHRLLATLVEQLGAQLQALSRLALELRADEQAQQHGLESGGLGTATLLQRLGTDLHELRRGEPVVLILDTMERVLDRPDDLMRLLDMLAQVHARAHGLRLVLAGRYDVCDSVRVPGYAGAFGGVTRSIELKEFSADEAHDYLVKRRKLAEEDPRLAIIVEKAGGNPFKLALLADVVQVRPEITAPEIADYKDPSFTYLIERVVERLPEDLRWVLRYGVIPRRALRKDFLREVMTPYLEQALREGKQALDDPARDPLPEKVKGRRPFRKSDSGRDGVHVDALWEQLYRYASDYSWVSPAGPDGLSFHPDVVEPMLDVIRQHDVFSALHRDAAEWFERRADAEPDERAALLAEAAYHRFQSGDDDADDRWLQLVVNAPDDEPDVREALARVVIDWSKLEPKGVDVEWDPVRDCPRGPKVIAAASGLLAQSLLDKAGRDPKQNAPLLHEADQLLVRVEKIRPSWDDLDLPFLPLQGGGVNVLRGQYHVARGAFDDAKQALGDVVQRKLPSIAPRALLKAHELFGQIKLATHEPDVQAHFIQAADIARQHAPDLLADVQLRLAESYEADEDFEQAAAMHRMLVSSADDDEERDERLVRLIRCELALGRESEAADLLPVGDLGGHSPELRRAAAEAHLALRATDSASLVFHDRYGRTAPPEPGDLEVEGLIRAANFDHDGALRELDRASERYDAGSAEKMRCLHRAAEVCIDETGQLDLARAYLERVSSPAPEPALRGALLRARRHGLLGERADAAERIEEALRHVERARSRGARVLVAVEAMSLAHDANAALGNVLDALPHVTPPSRRLLLLDGLRRCPTPAVPMDPRRADQLLALLPPPAREAHPIEVLRRVEVLRVLGRPADAGLLLDDLNVVSIGRLALTLEVRRARHRLDPGRQDDAILREFVSRGPAFQELYKPRPLSVTFLIEEASRVASWADAELVERALADADRIVSVQPRWTGQIAFVRAKLLHRLQDPAWNAAADRARRAFERSGDVVSLARLEGFVSAAGATHHRSRHLPAVTLELSRGPGRWTVRAVTPSGPHEGASHAPELDLLLKHTRSEAYERFAQRAGQPVQGLLASVLTAAPVELPAGPIAFTCPPELSWLPWEAGDDRLYRWSGRMASEPASEPSSTITVLGPSLAGRAVKPSGEVLTVEDLETKPAARVFFVAGTMSLRRNDVVLTPGGARVKRSTPPPEWSAPQLARFLSGAPQPLLVLEYHDRETAGRTETLRQVFLRNTFAADVAAALPGCSVLAIGPTQGDDVIGRLLDLLADGPTLFELARALRPAEIYELRTALFTDSPEARFPLAKRRA